MSTRMKIGSGGYRPATFMNNYPLEEYQKIGGIDETSNEKQLAGKVALTDYSDGITYREGSIKAGGIGLGRNFPIVGPEIYRGVGMAQSAFDAGFYCCAVVQFNAALTNYTQTIYSNRLDAGAAIPHYNSGAITTTPLPGLCCIAHLNGYDIYTDGKVLLKISALTTNYMADVIINPASLTITPAAYTAGVLNGFYAYAMTLVDDNGNETIPSYFNGSSAGSVTFTEATNNTINMTVGIGAVYSLATQNFKYIRVYRTISNDATFTANDNATMYYVKAITIVAGTANYSFADNYPDSEISEGVNPNTSLETVKLANVTYNQQLIPFSGGNPKFMTAWNNRIFIANVPGYPSRIYWSDFTDNTLQSNGNILSWNKQNYIDVDADDGSEIIGLHPGLGGRLFVFKENGTWIISSTGNTTANNAGQIIAPFRADKINDEYGMFHHSIAEVGGAVYGRTKDGIAYFNGSTYKIISHEIEETLHSCISPEGDSGIYDIETGRYYLAVCDARISGSYDQSFLANPSVLLAFRNTVLIYDMPTKSWEIHKNQFVQYFSKMKDSHGKQKIYAQGIHNDVFTLVDGTFYGAAFWNPPSSSRVIVDETNFNCAVTLPAAFVGKRVYISMVLDPTTPYHDFSFVNYLGTITAITGTKITVDKPIPGTAGNYLMVFIESEYGTVTASAATTITDTSNYFHNNYYTPGSGYTIALFDPLNVANDVYGTISTATSTVLTPTSGTWTGYAGYKYLIMPYNYIHAAVNTANYMTPRHTYITPPIGDRFNGQKKKKFNKFKMEIKGEGVLRIRVYLNGSSTADQTVYSTIPTAAATAFWPYYVHLKGSVANYIRVEISMIRGAGEFEITSFGARYRELGEMRNA